MKFLILDTDYPEFLKHLYSQHPGLDNQRYEEQHNARIQSLFGIADFYSSNLRKLGHEVWDIHVNNEIMQKRWAYEHNIEIKSLTWRFHLKGGIIPWINRIHSNWFYDILAAQIKFYKPDIILNQAMDSIRPGFLGKIKPYTKLLVGQHAATKLPSSEDWKCYDLVISSFPPTVDWFHQKGIRSELHRLGFEPEILSDLKTGISRTFDVTFIGSFFGIHSSRTALLEGLCIRFPQIKVWGNGIEKLPETSFIRNCYKGQAWGYEMYKILSNSKITLNHHGNIPPYANNLRLYEATGMGALLITDWKKNLSEMFEPGKEIVAYSTVNESAELIQYYLDHNNEREAIAQAGQMRTLREHTYSNRMKELIEIVEKHINIENKDKNSL